MLIDGKFLNVKTKESDCIEKRTSANSKEERDLIGKWIPKRYSNGETLPQILAKSKYVILKHKSKWNEQQQRAQVLFKQFPRLEQTYELCFKLTDIFNKRFKIGNRPQTMDAKR